MKSETGCAGWKRSALAGLRGTDSVEGERGVARPGEAEQGPHALDVSCRGVMGSVRTARSSRLARPSEGRFKRSGRRGRRGASRRKGSSEVQRRVRRASLPPVSDALRRRLPWRSASAAPPRCSRHWPHHTRLSLPRRLRLRCAPLALLDRAIAPPRPFLSDPGALSLCSQDAVDERFPSGVTRSYASPGRSCKLMAPGTLSPPSLATTISSAFSPTSPDLATRSTGSASSLSIAALPLTLSALCRTSLARPSRSSVSTSAIATALLLAPTRSVRTVRLL